MLNFDPTYQPYPSIRYPVYARNGMVCTSSSLATAAGLEILRKGGNAVDAAVATAACLTVVEPTANGMGSDSFALVWMKDDHKLYGLNSSGYSPRNISIEKVLADHRDADGKMPTHGWTPVMVPGAPKAWATLNRRFGRLPLTEVLAPAIRYASEGYPMTPNVAVMWNKAFRKFKVEFEGKPEFDEWFKTFTFDGKPPKAGDIVRLPNHAKTLRAIAETGADAFYKGEIADRIIADSSEFGGYFCKEDFASYESQWVEPISVNYRGCDVCEIPPNGQGIVALMALNILKHFDFPEKESAETYHRQWEAIKIAFTDALHHVTDPRCMKVNYHDLISHEYGAIRATEIGERAQMPQVKNPPKSGTVYLCTADGEGNMVSYIQSNYMGFGSGIVVRGTGISLQNRGHDFSLNPEDSNALAPAKKSYHTIIPGFLMKDGDAVGPFGVMGGYMQPQGHVQVIMNLIDFGLNPQQALDAPRWQWMRGMKFVVEDGFKTEIARQLAARGHEVSVEMNKPSFGRGQMIIRLENGVLVGGTESRTDSNIACY